MWKTESSLMTTLHVPINKLQQKSTLSYLFDLFFLPIFFFAKRNGYSKSQFIILLGSNLHNLNANIRPEKLTKNVVIT